MFVVSASALGRLGDVRSERLALGQGGDVRSERLGNVRSERFSAWAGRDSVFIHTKICIAKNDIIRRFRLTMEAKR
jgi:hypothetical protein